MPLLLIVAMAVGAVWAGIAGHPEGDPRGVRGHLDDHAQLHRVRGDRLHPQLLPRRPQPTQQPLQRHTDPAGREPDAWPEPGAPRAGAARPTTPTRSPGFLVVVAIVGTGFYLVVERSRFGFDLRATGINPFAAQAGGVSSRKMILITMLISGAHRRAGRPARTCWARRTTTPSEFPQQPRLQRHRRRPARAQQADRHRLRRPAVGVPRAVGADPRPQRHPAGDLRPDAGLDRAGRRGRVRDRPAGQGAQS